ncbi:MAG: glycosyltransferase [Chloroflexi bacterium]|nr:glycosyltransferase [Chloroflexota bacterium]MCI0575260.1 glycosyltransferase [Chloroflexota bacterium]MCI0645706.1 glycosyltransferase [Chloroflexota bacterium]MCI0731237.1 glycosyltransferase [Chloroflexota bacterium]
MRVAYVMSRFPKLTETFILYEIVALEEQGVHVALYPLWRERTTVMHPEARPLVERANYQPTLSWSILRANLYYLRRRPRQYLGSVWTLLRHNWGSLRYFFGALAIIPKSALFARQMTAEGISHIHAHFASHPAAAALFIHRLTGIPYSFTAHGSDIHREKRMLREKVAEAAFVVPISKFNREVIMEACGLNGTADDKLVVIHCGVDSHYFQPRPGRNGHSPDGGPLNLLSIGTLHEVKGQTHLVEACRLLREKGIPFTCRFVGDGPDEATLMAQAAAAGLTDCVHFLGRKTREEVVRLLQEADVLVAPSVPSQDGRREGIPVVLMEAMACGLPVVASRLSGIPELVKDRHTGLLVPPGEAEALAGVLARLYYEPETRRQMGQAGREVILQAFDLHANAAVLARRFAREVNQ